MSTGKKIFLWLLISPFLLFFIFSIIWDANWLRGQAEPHLEDVEGHQIDFASMEHSLYDPGYLEIQDITIKGQFINGSLGTLVLDASIKEAINKNIVIREITLKDTDLNIDMQAMQKWQEAQSKDEEETDSEVNVETDVDGFTIDKIYIEKVALKNVRIRDVSELQQFIVSGLSLTLNELNIAENAEVVIGNPDNPVNLVLAVDELSAMSSPTTRVLGEVMATQDLITLHQLNLTTEKSSVTANGIVRNPKAEAEAQLILQDSTITLDEFASMLPKLPVDTKGTLNLNGEIYAKGQLDNPVTLMNSLASNLNLVLDTGSSQLNLSGELRSDTDGHSENLEASDGASGLTHIKLHINNSKINLAEFAPLLQDLPIKPTGELTLAGVFTTSGQLQDSNSLLAALSGEVDMAMQDAHLQGIDINKIVSSFKESKETDLVDVGSFLLTGPIGILASNLMDLGGAAKFEGDTVLPQLEVKGQMQNGSINLHNTALATNEYRLAFDGAINPGNSTFKDFTFVILDDEGCADIKQTLNGKFTKPTSAVAKSLLDSALAPVTGLVNSVKNTAVQCTPFYEGNVQPPSKQKG